jgi:hypothetical protein
MDFSAALTTAEKQAACANAINLIEPSLYEACLNLGLIPADVASDYTAPGTLDSHPLEHRIESELAKLNAVKAHLASLSG